MKQLTPEQLEARRTYNREYKRKWRIAKNHNSSNPEYVERARGEGRAYYWRHRDECLAKSKEKWGKLNTEERYAVRLKLAFDMSLEEYRAMFAKQNGLCAICVNNSIGGVDHCHTTGEIRGLLCNRCNSGIGFFGDDITIMEKAIAYLCSHRKSTHTQKAS